MCWYMDTPTDLSWTFIQTIRICLSEEAVDSKMPSSKNKIKTVNAEETTADADVIAHSSSCLY